MKKENSEKKEFIILVILFIIVVILGALFIYNRFFDEDKHSTLGVITEKEDIVNYYEDRLEEVKQNDDEIVDETIYESSDTGASEVEQGIIEYKADNIEIVLGDLTGANFNESIKAICLNPKIKTNGNTKHLIHTFCDTGTLIYNNKLRLSYNDYIEDNINLDDMNESDCYISSGKNIYGTTDLSWMNSDNCNSEANIYFTVTGMNNKECYGIFKITVDCNKEAVLKSIEACNTNCAEDDLYSDLDKFMEGYGESNETIVKYYTIYTNKFLSSKYWTYKDYIEMLYSSIEHKQGNMILLILCNDMGGKYEVYLEPDTYEMIGYKTMNLSDVFCDEVLESL